MDSHGVDQVIHMDFEGVEAKDNDVPSMTKLLNQLVKESGVDPEQLAKILVSQNYIGNVLKPCIDDIDDDEDPEDQPVYAITSLINLSARDEIPVLAFQEFLRECLTADPVAHVKKQQDSFDDFKVQYGISQDEQHFGLLVKERMNNLPMQFLLPSLQSLMSDMEEAVEKGMPYDCEKIIYWSKMYVANGEHVHYYLEDGWFDENCDGYFDYPLKNADTVMIQDGAETVGTQIRRVYIFDGDKLASFVNHVKTLASGI